MFSILIVDAERLNEMPLAFQLYVKDYFEWKIVLGKEVYVAMIRIDYDFAKYHRKGVAPGHSVDLLKYSDGLDDDPRAGTRTRPSLNEWIHKEVERGEFLWCFYTSD